MKTVSIIGRVGADATTKQISEGTHVMEMNVFVNVPGKDKDAQVIKVQHFSSKPHGNTHLFKKGNLISASGTSTIDAYLSKDGQAKANEVLTANHLHLEVSAEANKEKSTEE